MSTEPSLKVVELPTANYRDPVKMLRELADDIEAGQFGGVETIAIATFSDDGLKVFGGGPDSQGPTVALLFSAAALRFAREIERA